MPTLTPDDFYPTLKQLQKAEDSGCGYCAQCGYEQCGVEPDAQGYMCDDCGCQTVHGPLLYQAMGHVQ